MVISAKGNAYQPTPPPQSGGEQAIRVWAEREFGRIASAIRLGRMQQLSLDVATELPAKPVEAMVIYFEAGVAGATRGAYEYRSGAWIKL